MVKRREYYPIEEELFANALERMPAPGIPLHVRRVLFRVLDEERRGLAAAWLSGSRALTDKDYEKLGVSAPLEDDEVTDLLIRLGSPSFDAGPNVLVLDQLDGLRKREQIWEIESLMIDLDGPRNWYVIVSLLEEKFRFWNGALSEPFKGKFGTIDRGTAGLNVGEISGPLPDQALELLAVRLSSKELREQRGRDNVSDPYHPLSEEQVGELAGSGASTARELLRMASDAYLRAVGEMRPLRRPLAEFLLDTFSEIREQLVDDDRRKARTKKEASPPPVCVGFDGPIVDRDPGS